MLLVAQHHRRAGIDLTKHVGPDLIELVIEFVAGLIGSSERVPGFDKIARFELGEKLTALLIQVAMQLVDGIVDVGIDAGERESDGVLTSAMIEAMSLRASSASCSTSFSVCW